MVDEAISKLEPNSMVSVTGHDGSEKSSSDTRQKLIDAGVVWLSALADCLVELRSASAERRLSGALARDASSGTGNARPSTKTGLPKPTVSTLSPVELHRELLNLTVKQHCVTQMILRDASNEDIAVRMGVTESTAKVHVRAVFRKTGVRNRRGFLLYVKPVWDQIDPGEYERAAGIPKKWDQNWTPADPHKSMYFYVGSGRRLTSDSNK